MIRSINNALSNSGEGIMKSIALLIFFISLVACGGGNQYGYAREYVPLSDEEAFIEKTVDENYEDVRRDPESFRATLISWFGVVTKVTPEQSTGTVKVAMELRFHQERHLCADQFESSCKVTVSERSGGPFTAILKLRSEDVGGEKRLYDGSLVRVYGKPNGDLDDRGGPVLIGSYYRHWPRNTFVTTALHNSMRR
jgi:hypothetical protein